VGCLLGLTPSVDDNLRMDALQHELFSLTEEFTGKNRDGGGAITDFFVLGAGNVDQYLSGWVVDVNRLQDCCSVVGHSNVLSGIWVTTSDALEDFVHALGSEGCLDEVRNCNCANK